MSEHEHILDIYGSIAVKTGEMLQAAQGSDWDRLIALEHDCRALIETLARTDAGAGTGARFVQRKIEFIRKALADDAEIRKLTEPWMDRLQVYLGDARQERRLRRAYETDYGAPG